MSDQVVNLLFKASTIINKIPYNSYMVLVLKFLLYYFEKDGWKGLSG